MNQKKIPARKGESRTYSYTFTLSQLVSLGAGLTVALTVFFVLGVLIGRGYRPEAEVPELARIMPSPQPANATAQQPQVLKPEELQYLEHLTQTPAAAKGHRIDEKPQERSPQEKAAERERARAEAEAKAKVDRMLAEEKARAVERVRTEEKAKASAQAKAKADAQAKADALAQARAEAKTKAAEPAKAGTEGVFDYVYQAAAFKDRSPAEDLRRRIESTGLKAAVDGSTENGVTWYRVNVLYHGTPSSTDDMRAKLASLGLGRPIMKSKKAAR